MVAIPKSVEIPVVYKIDNITGDPVFDTETMMRELETRISQFKNKYKYSPNPRLGDMDVWRLDKERSELHLPLGFEGIVQLFSKPFSDLFENRL